MYIQTKAHTYGYTAPAYHAGAYYACTSFIPFLDAIIVASIIILPVIVELLQYMTTS